MKYSIDLQRRKAMIAIGALTLSSLTACSRVIKPLPKSEITDSVPEPESVLPFLKPRKLSKNCRPAEIEYCLDVHTHFFNASDVNASSYLVESIGHTTSSIAQAFLRACIPIIDALASSAPSASQEFHFLVSRATIKTVKIEEHQRSLDIVQESHERQLASNLYEEIKKTNLENLHYELEKENFNTLKSQYPELKVPNKIIIDHSNYQQKILDAIQGEKSKSQYIQMIDSGAKPVKSMVDPIRIIEFMGHMLSYRWMSLRNYQIKYTENEEAFGIDGVFASLVDFDYFLNTPSNSSRQDQMKLHSLLSLLSGGYMIPIISYNPWTDINNSEASFNLVVNAINNYGFIGVKIYPPVGFFPYGNSDADMQVNSKYPRPDLKNLDLSLDKMFSWCAENSIPVMAHTEESMGRDDISDEFPKTKGWNKLIDHLATKSLHPVINTAHFGGDFAKDKRKPNTWTTDFALIAKSEPYFYGDLGYWNSLTLDCTDARGECGIAMGRITSALHANPDIINRVMYGTDWFMLSKETNWEQYPTAIFATLSDNFPANKFFYQNAINCFGFTKDGSNYRKIKERFSRLSGGIPNWLPTII